jgi:hypothetical protein
MIENAWDLLSRNVKTNDTSLNILMIVVQRAVLLPTLRNNETEDKKSMIYVDETRIHTHTV